jgi:hypothetical protein
VRGLKTCLSLLGICESRLCSPYASATATQQEEVKRALQELQATLVRP